MLGDDLVVLHDVAFSHMQRRVFEHFNIKVPKGKIVGIMGPSGVGKTTLLRLVGGQLQPSAGHIEFLGEKIHTLSRKQLYAMRRHMGMLFQNSALFSQLSVFENVAFPLREHTELSDELLHDIVLMKLQAVGLRGAAALFPNELSGGMARRVALARALALDPELIMYDEPFTGLDPITKGVIMRLIKSLNDALGMTSIVISHDIDELTHIADYLYLLSAKGIVAEGDAETMKHHDSAEVRQFMQGLADGVVPFHYPAADYQEELLS